MVTTEFAIAIAVIGIVLYVVCFWTAKTRVAPIPICLRRSVRTTLIHERRPYRGSTCTCVGLSQR